VLLMFALCVFGNANDLSMATCCTLAGGPTVWHTGFVSGATVDQKQEECQQHTQPDLEITL
jgi:hypothetical protein